MHIALVNQWYPPETGGGGVATHNYFFAKACAELGHKVTIIALNPRSKVSIFQTDDRISIIRVPSPDLYRLRRFPLGGRQYRFIQALLYSKRVCKTLEILNRHNPVDVAEFAEVNAEGYFWQLDYSRRLVIRCHTPAWILARYYTRSETPYDANLLGWAEKKTIRRAHLLTTPSQDLATVIAEECHIPPDLIHRIPNAMDTERFKPDIALNQDNELVEALFVGRLERQKGIDTLVKAIPLVYRQFSNIRFTIVGSSRTRPDGALYSDYVKLELKDYLTQGKVNLAGFVHDDELPGYYQRSHINLVPSTLYESFSQTAAQGMASGLPTVGSRIGGVPETLGMGAYGILVSPGNEEELAQGILNLARSSELRARLGNGARQYAIANFSAETVAQRTIAYYEAIQ